MKNRILVFILLLFKIYCTLYPQKVERRLSVEQRIDHYINTSVENGYSASVLVANKGKILISKGYGYADRENRELMTPNTIFNIGSVTKQFTAAAILKLSEEGKLKLSDSLGKYFNSVPKDKRGITIHQLLTHTSGIATATGGFRYDEASQEEFLEGFFQDELIHKPGIQYTYANANYILLAAIIEETSKLYYETYLKKNFWDPLQMDHTGYKEIAEENRQDAHGYYYHYISGEWRDWGITQNHLPSDDNHWYSIGKGDISSTVEDLYKWHLALENNTILSRDSKTLMETAHVPENEDSTSFYGYGWAIFSDLSNCKIVTHNGSNGIYFADFIRYTLDDLVIIVLSNVILNLSSENVAWEISKIIAGDNYQPKPIPKNTYELVFDFIRAHDPDEAGQLPTFIKNQTGSSIKDKAVLNRIGYKLISEALDSDWGIALLRLNVNLYPADGNLWDTLGEGYFLINEREKAKDSFQKALELGPEMNCHWCSNSTKRLEQLSTN